MENIEETEKESKLIFQRLQGVSIEAPPYLKTRVLAELREKRKSNLGLTFWRSLSLASSALSIVLVLLFVMQKNPAGPNSQDLNTFEVALNQAVSVKVELKGLGGLAIAHAEIDLPDGVEFYSEKHPEVREQKSLMFAWSKIQDRTDLPFVVAGNTTGERAVKVRFLNQKNEIVAEKTIKINFVAPQSAAILSSKIGRSA